ncbi:MAG: hypothetical protein ACE5EL_08505, partial [Anaerolineae bacterium]
MRPKLFRLTWVAVVASLALVALVAITGKSASAQCLCPRGVTVSGSLDGADPNWHHPFTDFNPGTCSFSTSTAYYTDADQVLVEICGGAAGPHDLSLSTCGSTADTAIGVFQPPAAQLDSIFFNPCNQAEFITYRDDVTCGNDVDITVSNLAAGMVEVIVTKDLSFSTGGAWDLTIDSPTCISTAPEVSGVSGVLLDPPPDPCLTGSVAFELTVTNGSTAEFDATINANFIGGVTVIGCSSANGCGFGAQSINAGIHLTPQGTDSAVVTLQFNGGIGNNSSFNV